MDRSHLNRLNTTIAGERFTGVSAAPPDPGAVSASVHIRPPFAQDYSRRVPLQPAGERSVVSGALRGAAGILKAACLYLAASGLALAQPAPDGSRDLSLVTHNAIVIAAAPERIWPHIVEPDAWKAGARLVPVGGFEHRFKAVLPGDPDTALFHVTNVEFDPPRRRTIRLNALDGALIGHASWELTPVDGGTRVAYHVYSQQESPADQPPIDREAYVQANRTRFQNELNALRRLVESGSL